MFFRKFILTTLLLLAACYAFSQRSANWFFGDHAGIKFTSSGVVNQPTSTINTDEGCSSLSDTAGNLLFYTDGINVWNKNHIIMTNGAGLLGNSSSSQSSIVVPKPGSDSLYYIFTATLPSTSSFYYYNVVDMSKQGGLGEVIEKNVRIGGSRCSERITAVQHANKRHFWIITNPYNTDSFRVYLLTEAGLQPTSVDMKLGIVANSNFGMLKASPDGTMVVHTVGNSSGYDHTQLFHFNANTGQLYDLIRIPYPRTYGCAFSPDSKRLYLNNSFPLTAGKPLAGSMAQFTVSVYDSAAIASSKYLFPFSANSTGGWGDLSVGPDSIMYLARHFQKRLSAFKKPNDSAAASMFVDTFITLTGTAHYGLPNFYNNINVPPNISINMNRLSCLQYEFSFNTNYSGTGTYTWDFGDGTTDATATPVHTFSRTATDSFLVKFHFISTDGTVNISVQNWLKLPPKPVAAFTVQTNGCIEKPLVFTNTSNSANGTLEYYWNFGDATTETVSIPVKLYADTGHYLIKLAVKDVLDCLSDTTAIPVVVNKKAVARFGLHNPFCTGANISISDTSYAWNTNITQWRYDFGDRIITSPSALPFISYSLQGVYNIKLVLNTNDGCVSDTVLRPVQIFSKPTAGFILPQSCVTDVSAFTDTSSVQLPSVINKWRWDFDDPAATNDTSLAQHATYQYSSAASYQVTLIVSTNKGCVDTLTQLYTVNGAEPKAAISFIDNPVCGIDSVQLVDASSVNFGKLIALQINWGNGITTNTDPVAGKIYKNIYPLFGTPATQTFPVTITAQSGISCFDVLDTTITIKAQPQVQMLPPAAICSNGSPITLIEGSEISGAVGTENYFGAGVSYQAATNSYRFNPNLVSGSSAVIGYRFITPGGCVDTATAMITLFPKPIVDAGQDKVILYGNSTTLDATASGAGLTYSWTPSLWLNKDDTLKPVASPLKDTTYWIRVISSDNCIDSSAVFIRVLQPVNPPNAFSPNGDGINEKWMIPNIHSYPYATVQVFTRWGQQVFQSRGYNNPWDGNYQGKPLPVGTYYYIIIPGEGRETISGWLQLLR